MPTTYNMSKDDEIYRAVLSHEVQQVRWENNPNGGPRIRVPEGPVTIDEFVIGPYTETRSIKSWLTRNRDRYYKNLKLVRVEKVVQWEEVDL